MSVFRIFVILSILVPFIASASYSQEASSADLAKQAQNPIANLISLPLQNNTNFGIGPEDETQNILNNSSEIYAFILRPILPTLMLSHRYWDHYQPPWPDVQDISEHS